MKGKIILGSLIVLFIALAVPNVSAAFECNTPACHQNYYDTINAKQHSGSNGCTYCHQGGYDTSAHQGASGKYIGYVVNETTCTEAFCHSPTSGYASHPVSESHSNKYYPPNGKADCTDCHFANTTRLFPLNSTNSLYVHDHNFTVEYNFYNYSLYGMPLESNHSASKKGMFPYYTCTLTCHSGAYKIEDEVIAWNQSGHAQLSGSSGYNWTNRTINSTDPTTRGCITCKSPTQFNPSIQVRVAISDWQGIQCRVCHNIHNDTYSGNAISIAFYNGTLSYSSGRTSYDTVVNDTVLCEKCHTGYHNPINYSGFHKTALGFTCASCHVNSTINSGATHTFEVKNTATGNTGCEACHQVGDHTFQYTSNHTGKATCEACHDKTVSRNDTGYAMSYDGKNGLYNDAGLISSFKYDHGTPLTWPLNHNISKDVSCNKCHGTLSNVTGTLLAPTFGTMGCIKCHSSYASAVNNSMHNQTRNAAAPDCTDCHTGYDTQHNGYTGYIVNESNACRTCHVQNVNLNESHGNHNYGQNYTDCTQCHFANTTQQFSLNSSLYTHDHNLTVEYNYYNYSLYGFPTESDHSTSKKGMFPYYTCTLTCHGTGSYSVEDEVIAWSQSGHGQLSGSASYNETNRTINRSDLTTRGCLTCKSPTQFNTSIQMKIAPSDFQGIQCRICHNIHNDTYSDNDTTPVYIAFYNGTLRNLTGNATYDAVENATVLCEKCHTGYHNPINYSGSHKTDLNFTCASCHMNSTINNGLTHTFEVSNIATGDTGCEACHQAGDHTFQYTSNHTGKATCEACHDKTVSRNASGYAMSSDLVYGLYNDTTTGLISSFKYSSKRVPSTKLLNHNTSKDVSCNKCHGTLSNETGLLAPTFGAMGCVKCHSSYASAVNNSMHNKTKNTAAPDCIDCHKDYDTNHTGYTGYIVNESNTCRNSGCHEQNVNLNESHGNHNYGQNYTDCTQCHFANTTKTFSGFNSSLYTHDHNLTVEYNYYNYNLYGFPTESDHSASKKGMFPYYTCTLTCHNGTSGQLKIENETIAWSQSGHAQASSHGSTYNKSCLKCHSPPMYNASNGASFVASVEQQGIQCRVCHNLHNDTYSDNDTTPVYIAFYNAILSSSAGSPVYDTVATATELCEKCHAGGHHYDTRDIYYSGSHKTSLGFTCADCHMNSTINNGSEHSFEVKNDTTTKTGCEACHVAASVHTGTNFSLYSSHLNVTCDACHDDTFVRNSSDFVVNVSTGKVSGGIYKNPSTNKWTTYRGTSTAWVFHNISNNVTCEKCHGARSVVSGAIASNLTTGGITYYTTDALVVGYNFIVPWLYPEPTIYANYLINSSLSGVTGVNKTLNWNSTAQKWEGYEYIDGVYFGTNFTVVGKTPYFVNSLSTGKTYTFKGRKL